MLNGFYDNNQAIGAQYKGYDECHGVIDGYAFWKFNDKKKLDYLISHAITNIISWDDLKKSLSDDLFQSDEMTDVLLYI